MKKYKWLLPIVSATALVTPMCVSLASCKKKDDKYKQVVANIKQAAIEEFKQICNHPRPTGNCDEIRHYLLNRIYKSGYIAQTDNYGNIWFDIPATNKREDDKKLIFQGHMDMVVAGMTQAEQAMTPIYPTIETIDGQQVMHSVDYKTSLGADNGIGIGIMLAIMDNEDIEHGPIRFIITADEESGMVGASRLNPIALDSDYLLNIDGETGDQLIKSSAGSVQGLYADSIDAEAMKTKNELETGGVEYGGHKLSIKGLRGGHSGVDIKGRLSADRALCEILKDFNDEFNNLDGGIALYSFEHNDEHDQPISWGPTQIITAAQTYFLSTKPTSEMTLQKVIESKKAEWKTKYPDENWDNVEIKLEDWQTQAAQKFIQLSTSYKIITLTGTQYKPELEEQTGLPYGYLPSKDPHETRPEASANIGPLSIVGREFSLKNYSRSAINQNIDWFENNNKKQWMDRFTAEGFSTPTKYYGWAGDNPNKMIDLMMKAGKYFEKEQTIVDMLAGLELCWFKVKRPTINLTSIGPTITFAHNVKETLYLDTLDFTIERMLYAMDHINEIE